jgi:hypothetical protein
LGTLHLKPAYEDALERALRATSMADYCGPDSASVCTTYRYWQHKHRSRKLGFCGLYTHRMNGRRSPTLESSQRACRAWADVRPCTVETGPGRAPETRPASEAKVSSP